MGTQWGIMGMGTQWGQRGTMGMDGDTMVTIGDGSGGHWDGETGTPWGDNEDRDTMGDTGGQ